MTRPVAAFQQTGLATIYDGRAAADWLATRRMMATLAAPFPRLTLPNVRPRSGRRLWRAHNDRLRELDDRSE